MGPDKLLMNQDRSCQQQRLQGRMFSKKAATNVHIPRVSHSPPLPIQETLQEHRYVCLGSYQITAFSLGPSARKILYVPFKNEVSISPSPEGLNKLIPTGLQSQELWGLIFPVPDSGSLLPDAQASNRRQPR